MNRFNGFFLTLDIRKSRETVETVEWRFLVFGTPG